MVRTRNWQRPLYLLLATTVCLSCSGCTASRDGQPTYPAKPIKVIVPFDAGGGSDTFTRIIQQAIEQEAWLPQRLVVINVPGAGGTVGSRRAKNARPDGYTLLQLHDGLLTSKYSGSVEYGPEAFRCIAGTGRMPHVIAVREDSHYADLRSLLQTAATQPDSILFGVGIGAPSHFAGLMLESAEPGAEFRFTQTGGGAKRFASLLGEHTDVTTFSIAEYVDFGSGGLRALAVLSTERHAEAPEIPTAREQGIDVVSTNMHFWWAPKGTPDERIEVIANALSGAMMSDQVQATLREMLVDPVVLLGDELQAELEEREQQTAAVSQRPTRQSSRFPLIVLSVCGLLAAIVAGRGASKLVHPPSEVRQRTAPVWQCLNLELVVVATATILFVASMQFGWSSFRTATCLFVLLSGGILTRRRLGLLPAVVVVALCLSFGLHALFTHVLVIDLPQ